MEPITLCGLVIVMFGLWVEFEPAVKKVVKMICNSRFLKVFFSNSNVQMPVYVRRTSICATKGIGV